MFITLSICSTPFIALCRPGGFLDLYIDCIKPFNKISLTSVDLPEPETPVTATKQPKGKSTSMFLRLFSRAPKMLTYDPLVPLRSEGTGSNLLPAKYSPVNDFLEAIRPFTSPE